MKAQELLNEILPIVHSVKEDPIKLEKILQFLLNEVYEEPEEKDKVLEVEDEIKVPERYAKVVSEIAGYLDAGMVCFLNLNTLEMEYVPNSLMLDPEEFEMMTGETFESMDYKYPTWENSLTFEPLESRESFKIMQKFTNNVDDKKLQNKLAYALNNRKPFANFKFHIDNSEYRQQWFDFKKHYLEVYVKEWLSLHLDKIDGKFDLEERI